ncbi:MAG: hypothetical protein EOM52_08540, partial [Clostridia bacterium]|nr:hypothetical protein [Clostridia bacterium]
MSTIINQKQFPNHKIYKTEIAGRPFSIEVGKTAELANAAALARIMQKDRQPNLLLTRIDIADKAKQGVLVISDMNLALRRFPEDVFLLQKSVELNLQTGNWAKASQDLQILQKKMPDNADLGMLFIMALSGLQKFSEADAVFADLLQKSPDNLNLLNNFLNYCNSQKRIDC